MTRKQKKAERKERVQFARFEADRKGGFQIDKTQTRYQDNCEKCNALVDVYVYVGVRGNLIVRDCDACCNCEWVAVAKPESKMFARPESERREFLYPDKDKKEVLAFRRKAVVA